MRTESKRRKAFGGTALTLLLSALVLGGSFLAAALMEYTIPRETDETVEPGDIREPVVYPAGDLKYSLYPWSYYDERKCRTITEKEAGQLQWVAEFLSQMLGTDFTNAGLPGLFQAVVREGITYFFIDAVTITDAGGQRYMLDCAAEEYGGLVYFSCHPEQEVPDERWRDAYRGLEDLAANWKVGTESEGIYEPLWDGECGKEQWSFVQSLEWLGELVNRYPLYRLRQLFDFLNEAEVLLTDSDLLVVCSGYQMNVLFIDPQTCRIIGCGSAA